MQTEAVTIYSGTSLGKLENVEAPVSEVDGLSEEAVAVDVVKHKMLRSLVECLGPGLTPGEKDIFFDLHLSHAGMMASSKSDLGRMDKLHESVPLQHSEEVHELLEDMLKKGVIEL